MAMVDVSHAAANRPMIQSRFFKAEEELIFCNHIKRLWLPGPLERRQRNLRTETAADSLSRAPVASVPILDVSVFIACVVVKVQLALVREKNLWSYVGP